MSLPFNKPFIAGKELYNIADAVIRHGHLAGDGKYTRRCQKWIEKTLLCKKCLLTHSCTGALEMAAMLCDIQPNDEVIMPSYSFVSTANAFVLRGGVPVFTDIRPDTLNIDESLIEEAITGRTKAIVPVHYAGVPCNMSSIQRIAKKHGLIVVEDAAQAMLSKNNNSYLGTIGDLGAISFHETKNIISGEGGVLLINNERFIERAEIIWEKGTNRKQFFRGEVDKYTWVDIGSSFLPSELTAAFLYAQLEHAEKILTTRRHIYNLYRLLLKPLEEKNMIRLPYENQQTDKHNGHIFYIITRDLNERTQLMNYLRKKGIYAVFHFVPLHSSPAGKKFGKTCGDLRITEDTSHRLLRLPLYFEMQDDDVKTVTDAIFSFFKQKAQS